jgi:hypothetical protein
VSSTKKTLVKVLFVVTALLLLMPGAAAFAQEPPENRPPENRPPAKEAPTPPPDCDVSITLLPDECEVGDLDVTV